MDRERIGVGSVIKKNNTQVSKLKILYDYLSFYPVTQDEVVMHTIGAITQERKKYYDNFNNFIKSSKGKWTERVVFNQPYYFTEIEIVLT